MAAEKNIQQRVGELLSKGKTHKQVADVLKSEGYKNRAGKTLQPTHVGYYARSAGLTTRRRRAKEGTEATSTVTASRTPANASNSMTIAKNSDIYTVVLPVLQTLARTLTPSNRIAFAIGLLKDTQV